MPVKVAPVKTVDYDTKSRYYYIARGQSYNANPIKWEGGIAAVDLANALGLVKQMSIRWTCRYISIISIYEVDQNGVIDEQPSICQIFDADNPLKPTQQSLLPAPEKDKKVYVSDLYESAEWMQNTDIPSTFTTVTMKETQS